MKIYVALALCLFLTSCQNSNERQSLSDEYIADKIVGTWAESFDKDGRVLFYNTYFKDGHLHGVGYLPDNGYWYIDSVWHVINGESCFEIKNIYGTDLMVPGEKFCNKVVSITDKKFTFETSSGSVTMIRISDGFQP